MDAAADVVKDGLVLGEGCALLGRGFLVLLEGEGVDVLGGLGDGVAEGQVLGVIGLLAGDEIAVVELAQL